MEEKRKKKYGIQIAAVIVIIILIGIVVFFTCQQTTQKQSSNRVENTMNQTEILAPKDLQDEKPDGIVSTPTEGNSDQVEQSNPTR